MYEQDCSPVASAIIQQAGVFAFAYCTSKLSWTGLSMKRKAGSLIQGLKGLICSGRWRGFHPQEREAEGKTVFLPKTLSAAAKEKGNNLVFLTLAVKTRSFGLNCLKGKLGHFIFINSSDTKGV